MQGRRGPRWIELAEPDDGAVGRQAFNLNAALTQGPAPRASEGDLESRIGEPCKQQPVPPTFRKVLPREGHTALRCLRQRVYRCLREYGAGCCS